ncbi:MAG: hypothetical protein QMD14_02360 [Candidatus Aenigmarchaeota archaeon]|nr:hypothetical protein [Candidatus Aenigmarchaeota archaeon]
MVTMQKEKIDVVKLLHEGTWKKINNYFGKDLSLPYIYRTTRSHAYKEVFNSIQDSGVFVPEIPVTHALLYFYPGRLQMLQEDLYVSIFFMVVH